ncbi:MAG: hypothetical protein IAF94_03805 [Pirellulaceae bacterium]|nr:hypothetical protein [Pirellulaceae bacterium]
MKPSSFAWPAIIIGSVFLSGCGFIKFPPAQLAQQQPTAPIIGEPSLVRVQSGKLNIVQGAAGPLSPPGEEAAEKGYRFIAVGFPIGPKQTLSIDDYELLDNPEDPQVPFAVGGEGPGAPQFFSGTEYFAESVVLTQGTKESTGMEGQSSEEDATLLSWETPSSVVLMLFEITDDTKSVTLRHGSRTFKLEPDAGLINGQPGAGK